MAYLTCVKLLSRRLLSIRKERLKSHTFVAVCRRFCMRSVAQKRYSFIQSIKLCALYRSSKKKKKYSHILKTYLNGFVSKRTFQHFNFNFLFLFLPFRPCRVHKKQKKLCYSRSSLSKYTTLNIQQQIQSSNFVAFAFEKISGHSQSFHQTEDQTRKLYA
jgi:hypothetical protein